MKEKDVDIFLNHFKTSLKQIGGNKELINQIIQNKSTILKEEIKKV